jgi:hypothetical protein
MLLRDARTPRSAPATKTVRNEEIAREKKKVATIVKFGAAGGGDAQTPCILKDVSVLNASRRLGAENEIIIPNACT